MKKLLVLIIAMVAVLTLAGCNRDKEDEGVVFNWNIGADPRTLDPSLNGATDGGDVINNTFEGLVREKNGEVLPGMATSWTVSTDGKTITFDMRDDAKWSDGTALNADDFVRSWLRAMDPANASEYSWIWHYTNVVGSGDFVDAARAMDDNGTPDDDTDDFATETEAEFATRKAALKAAVGVESLDNGDTLKVTLSAPTNWFVSLMAFYHFMPVPDGVSVEGEGAWAKDPDLAVSNGPFTLSEYTVGDKLQLVKNDNYWNAEDVKIDVINGFFIDAATTAYARFEAGELDFIPSVPTAEIPALLVASDEFYVFPSLGTYYVSLNLSGCEDGGNRDIGDRDNAVFCNDNLRTALSLSIDREAITDALGAGQVPAGGFIPPGFTDHNGDDFFDNSKDDSDIVTDDGSYAIALDHFKLAADELYPNAANQEAALELLRTEMETHAYHINTSETHVQIAVLIQGMWNSNLGFEIQVTNEEWALFQATRTDGAFDVTRGGWLTDFMDPSGMLAIFTPGNAYNDPDYSNDAFTAKLEDAKNAVTPEDHFNALYDAHEIFMADMPIIPVYHYNDSMLVKSYLVGWTRSVLGSIDFSGASMTEK